MGMVMRFGLAGFVQEIVAHAPRQLLLRWDGMLHPGMGSFAGPKLL